MPNGMMGNPMGAQPSVEQPMEGAPIAPAGQPVAGGADDAVLDMHLTEDVKSALQAKGIDISAVMDRGPKEPVIVIPVSIIMQKYPADSPEDSMRQFVQEMTQGGQPPEQVSAPTEMAAAEVPTPSPEGLGAPTDRPPMVA
jgi:hypothetical protein